jgi:hypothetical protein
VLPEVTDERLSRPSCAVASTWLLDTGPLPVASLSRARPVRAGDQPTIGA